jgi:predicted nucleotidyltransferase
MCDKTILNTIIKKICTSAKDVLGDKLEKIVLYGSYARGDYDEDSDIDIMVLADIPLENADNTHSRIRERMGGYRLDLEYDVLVSVLVVSSSNYRKYADTLPLYMNVRKEGVELYA